MGAAAGVGVQAAVDHTNLDDLQKILPQDPHGREKIRQALDELDNVSDDAAVEKRLRALFDDCDADGSGSMGITELSEALRREVSRGVEYGMEPIVDLDDDDEILELFNEADTDKSGQLSIEEFIKLMQEQIDASRQLSSPKSRRDGRRNSRRGGVQLKGKIKPLRQGTTERLEPLKEGGVDINNWSLDYWTLDVEGQRHVFQQSISEWDCLSEVNVAPVRLFCFFDVIKATYRDNPYHNFLHALSTVHYAFKMVQAAGLTAQASKKDLFCLAIASLCHDCDHRGRNNAFEIMTRRELALRYNDKSPLENHHCATAFQAALCSHGDSCNIFAELDAASFSYIRQCVVEAILGTDMVLHNKHVKKLESFVAGGDIFDESGLIVEVFTHAADISNPVMPNDMSMKWGAKIAEEFTLQSEEETKLGIPVTAMMTGLKDPKTAARSTKGFIEFVFAPMGKSLFLLFPGLREAKEHMEQNIEHLKRATA